MSAKHGNTVGVSGVCVYSGDEPACDTLVWLGPGQGQCGDTGLGHSGDNTKQRDNSRT